MLLRTFGCVRLVYNEALDVRTAAWLTEKQRVNYEQTSAEPLKIVWSGPLGIDAGIATLFTLSTGEKIANPMHERRDRVHARIADRRRDFLHKVARAMSDAGWTQFRSGCGKVHDRDVNAARTILAAGLVVAACGDGVRPSRRKSARHLSHPPFAETEAGNHRP